MKLKSSLYSNRNDNIAYYIINNVEDISLILATPYDYVFKFNNSEYLFRLPCFNVDENLSPKFLEVLFYNNINNNTWTIEDFIFNSKIPINIRKNIICNLDLFMRR